MIFATGAVFIDKSSDDRAELIDAGCAHTHIYKKHTHTLSLFLCFSWV